MAETYIPRGAPVSPNRRVKPSEPVISGADPQHFPRVRKAVQNSSAAVIAKGPKPDGGSSDPVSNGSTEARFSEAAGIPISNDVGGYIQGDHGNKNYITNEPPPPPSIVTNREASFMRGGAPISNADKNIASSKPPPAPAPHPNYLHIPAPVVVGTFEAIIGGQAGAPPPPQAPVNAGNGGVQILPPTAPPLSTGDTVLAGGGDTTKLAGTADVNITGKGGINVGGGETYMAPSGDTTKDANQEHRTLGPEGEKGMLHVGDNDTLLVPSADPTKTAQVSPEDVFLANATQSQTETEDEPQGEQAQPAESEEPSQDLDDSDLMHY